MANISNCDSCKNSSVRFAFRELTAALLASQKKQRSSMLAVDGLNLELEPILTPIFEMMVGLKSNVIYFLKKGLSLNNRLIKNTYGAELNNNQSLTSFDTCMMFIDVQIVLSALIKYFSACALSRNCLRYLNDIMHALHSTSSNTERTAYDRTTEHFCRQCGHYCTECIVEMLFKEKYYRRSEPSLMIASKTNGRFLIFLTSLSNVFYRIANEALINAGYLAFSNDYCNAFCKIER
ncbi:hypothetical protein T11_876 [Trichinella zimbabwensis]|uniref:Uncharacterized protein n=1 Tax=Trichinella zimbabwensis TaxID=268475 RepID=A0A0V1HPG9_9BILA|nr:hypothetical protein T11_876 [Trichinella zimbabwensis]